MSVSTMQMYCIYDTVTKEHAFPFAAVNRDHALRAFKQLKDDSSTFISRYPDEFVLKYVGDFNISTGVISFDDSLVCEICAVELLDPKECRSFE